MAKRDRIDRDRVATIPRGPALPDPRAQDHEVAAEWVPIGELRPWGDNPRRNDGEPVRKVAESIKRFGFGAPIVARKANGEIIAGHTRWKAAQHLGLDRVPVRFVDLDPAQAHLLALADNRTAEESEWDTERLEALLRPLTIDDALGTGMDFEEIGKLLDRDEGEVAPESVEVVDAGFTLQVSGPLAGQLDVVAKLREVLAGIEGVTVEAL